MNQRAKVKAAEAALIKKDPNSPALLVTGAGAVSIKAGTILGGVAFKKNTPVRYGLDLVPGGDYVVTLVNGKVALARTLGIPQDDAVQRSLVLGGFHFAPGGNAKGRGGGDDVPQVNPSSIWDRNFRPACPDPRGMTLVEAPHGKFWCDIYLTGADHLDGTSRLGANIADGNDPPQQPDGGRFKKFDYETAAAVMKHHGKSLLSVDDFFAAAFGVTERSVHSGDPRTTKLDASRTSRFGLMQATGNLWVWGHDGDPDLPRASIFGGSWWDVGYAGSRCASVACNWPGDSHDHIGARGRGDHLQRA